MFAFWRPDAFNLDMWESPLHPQFGGCDEMGARCRCLMFRGANPDPTFNLQPLKVEPESLNPPSKRD